MSYFVIGVSGITCGGKTTLSKLLQRSFPWCRVIHQDTYFYDDDSEHHIRLGPDCENHVNYEIFNSMNMNQMHEDVTAILSEPGKLHPYSAEDANDSTTPNFDTGLDLLKSVTDIDFDSSKYSHIPVLILEGFTIFGSEILFDKCDVRFFLTLEEEECRTRRNHRSYIPPDCPGYFEKAIWPEYIHHYDNFIDKRTGIKVFEGNIPIQQIWKQSVEIVSCRLEEKQLLKTAANYQS